MKNIYQNDFLLTNAYGKKLFHEVAAALPIIDFHNHIDPAALASNKRFENIYQLWVQHDPYKHRAMRMYGISEKMITGNASDVDKFLAWATCLTHTVGNPLFHWSCMELKVFGMEEVLTPKNARQIWENANHLLCQNNFSALAILKHFGVETLCTSDDLLDNLEHHISLQNRPESLNCLPSLRGDSMINFKQGWLNQVQKITKIQIADLDSYKKNIINRLNFFDESGCLLADHALDSGFKFIPTEVREANQLFENLLKNKDLEAMDLIKLQSHLLHFLGQEYAKRQWKMQLHIGAFRLTNSKLRNKLGAAGGYACIGNTVDVPSLSGFLDGLDRENNLPKTILYTLNPADNAVFASLTGSYAEDGVKGKIQFGPAWWYNDHHEGIVQQLLTLSNYGLLSTAIGFTTDSRSILSFTRHDYYRRILCNLIGSWVKEGKLPDDWEFIATLVSNIAYNNVKNWIKK